MTDAAQNNETDSGSTLAGVSMAWDPAVEAMLAKWCDEAKCFEWMHTQSFTYYDKHSRYLTIASNCLTAVSGVTNVIAGGAVINGFQMAWFFGGLSVIISITNMLQEKLAYAAKSVEHDNHARMWGNIRRKIEEEVSVPPESRKDCGMFLKYLRQDFGQVAMSGNSLIPEFIRDACSEKFGKIQDFDVPDVCGNMEHTKVYVKPNP